MSKDGGYTSTTVSALPIASPVKKTHRKNARKFSHVWLSEHKFTRAVFAALALERPVEPLFISN